MLYFIFLTVFLGTLISLSSAQISNSSEELDCQPVPVLSANPDDDDEFMPPTVMIAVLARNKAMMLPHFLGSLEALDYPKSRISLWIRSDHNEDNTEEILDLWVSKERDHYNSINYEGQEDPVRYSDEQSIYDWTPMRYDQMISLREDALQYAKDIWADYIWFLDCDSILTNSYVLSQLVHQKKIVIAPMLQSSGAYSNVWCGMNEKMYYKRTANYLSIVEREKTGCFEAPMVHSATLIDLRRKASSKLTFDPSNLMTYDGPIDDIITFATSARIAGVPLFILNYNHFGYIMSPLSRNDTEQDEFEQLINMRLEALVEGPPLPISRHLVDYVSKMPADKMAFDQIYLINLERRTERRDRMLKSLEEIGLQVHLMNAVDGRSLNDSYLSEIGVQMLPSYKDPHSKRSLKMGEVGCFMSHYSIWKDMLAHQHRNVLVLEDDVRFEPYFRRKLQIILDEIKRVDLNWELIYIGRKRLSSANEPFVPGASRLVKADYSYWTLAYLLSLEGARKLVDAQPLSKMVPVDEYLPIMFDRHPEVEWKKAFEPRDLRAFSSHPLLAYPTHYTGETNYLSDTEDSEFVPSQGLKAPDHKVEL